LSLIDGSAKTEEGQMDERKLNRLADDVHLITAPVRIAVESAAHSVKSVDHDVGGHIPQGVEIVSRATGCVSGTAVRHFHWDDCRRACAGEMQFLLRLGLLPLITVRNTLRGIS
jgi:hypothetical protein